MRTQLLLLILIAGCAHSGHEDPDHDQDPCSVHDAGLAPQPIVQMPAQDAAPAADLAQVPHDLVTGTAPDSFATDGRIGSPCYSGSQCGSGICIGEGESYPGVCVTRLCGTDAECSPRPCVVNTRQDKDRHPRYCAP